MNEDNLKDIFKSVIEQDNNTEISETELKIILKNKTKNIFSKLKRNIKIGYILIGVYLLLAGLSYYWIFTEDNSVNLQYREMDWLLIFDITIDIFLISTFLNFAFKYIRLSNLESMEESLANTLQKIIELLSDYKKIFVIGFTLSLVSAFSGMIWGIVSTMAEEMKLNNIPEDGHTILMIISILFGTIVMSVFFILVWFIFKKLYGNYIKQLKIHYAELKENE